MGFIDALTNRPRIVNMRSSSKKLIETLPDEAPVPKRAYVPEITVNETQTVNAEKHDNVTTTWTAPAQLPIHEGVHVDIPPVQRPIPPPPPPMDPDKPNPEQKPEPEPEMPELTMDDMMENVPEEKRPKVQHAMKNWYDNFARSISK